MVLTFRIFTHALSMVFRDPGATLRATYAGALVIAVSVAIFLTIAPDMFNTITVQRSGGGAPALMEGTLAVVAGVLFMGIGYLMMIIAWHRFVLLQGDARNAGFTPSAGIVLGYIGRSILIGLIVTIAAIPVLILVAMINSVTGTPVLAGIAFIPAFTLLGWIVFRLSLILPACTIGKDPGVRESWETSKPLSGPILGLMILLGVADFVIDNTLGLISGIPVLGGLISVVVSVLFALVSASILTTIYGIAIEKRNI